MEAHIRTIAILWIIFGGLGLLFAAGTYFIINAAANLPDLEPEGEIILRTVATAGGIFIAVLSIPEILAGIGLLQFKEWGRILTLAVAFFALLEFPVGTALGVYSIVILLKNETLELIRAAEAGGAN